MIIDLKKYKEHGYLKALWHITVKMFLSNNQKVAPTQPPKRPSNSDKNIAVSNDQDANS